MSMDCKDFRLWRQKLALTQEGAALKFGLSRATIVNWENGTTPISPAVEAACQHFTREWKQRPEAGPVTLLYGDAPMALSEFGPRRVPLLQQERYPTNDAAIRRSFELWDSDSFYNPLIVDDEGAVVWNVVELSRERSNRITETETGRRPMT